MNIYYTEPSFIKLPNELQNNIFSFLPRHPIEKLLRISIMGIFFDEEDSHEVFLNNNQFEYVRRYNRLMKRDEDERKYNINFIYN